MSKVIRDMNRELKESIRLLDQENRIIDKIINKQKTISDNDKLELKRY